MSLPKTDLEKNKTAMIPDEQSHGLLIIGTHRESCKKKNVLFPMILG